MACSYDGPYPAVAVDIAIFTVRASELCALLVKRAAPPYQGEWALPGGFVNIDESLKRAAWRELKDETGVHAVYLEQLYTFGHPQRDPRGRIVTVAYFALIPADKVMPKVATDAEDARWFSVDSLPALAFDHQKILRKARGRLAAKIDYSTLAFQLMPDTFTLPELQHVYEAIAAEKIDKRNFRKRILSLNVIAPTGDQRRAGAHRPAKLYRVIDITRVDVIK